MGAIGSAIANPIPRDIFSDLREAVERLPPPAPAPFVPLRPDCVGCGAEVVARPCAYCGRAFPDLTRKRSSQP